MYKFRTVRQLPRLVRLLHPSAPNQLICFSSMTGSGSPPSLLTTSTPWHQQQCRVTGDRNFSKVTDNQTTELYFEEIFEQGFSGEDPLFDLRNYFYPESEDPDIVQLSNAGCVSEVLDIVTGLHSFNHKHLTQAVATLHHLQKLSQYVGQTNLREDFRVNLIQFNQILQEDEKYQKLLEMIEQNILNLQHPELAFILMALRKFQEPLSSSVLVQIFLELQSNFAVLDAESLSYLSVGMRPRLNDIDCDDSAWVWRTGLVSTLPRLKELLSECESPEELRMLAICMSNLSSLVSDRMMDLVETKVTQFIADGKLDSLAQLNVLCKLLALVVTKQRWHDGHGDYVNLLLSQFIGKVKFLRPNKTNMLAKVLTKIGEPVCLEVEVYQRLDQILVEQQFRYQMPLISIISQITRFNSHGVPIKEVEAVLSEVIDSPHLADHVNDVYDIMRNVGIIDDGLVDKFFMNALEALKNEPHELLRFGIRYTNLHNVFTRAYKNKKFEKRMVEVITKNMNNERGPVSSVVRSSVRFDDVGDVDGNAIWWRPDEFARNIGLLMYFGHEISEKTMDRLEELIYQISPLGLLAISRGIDQQIRQNDKAFHHIMQGGQVPRSQRTPYMDRMEEISLLVNKASRHKLEQAQTRTSGTLNDLIHLTKSFYNRIDVLEEGSIANILRKLEDSINQSVISTRIVKELCSILMSSRMTLENPVLLDTLVEFILSRPNPREVHTRFLYKLLMTCELTSHAPDLKFLELMAHCVQRDIHSLTGLTIIYISKALCAFDALPQSLVNIVFSNEIMSKFDKELDLCIDRRHYPNLLRKALMQLNRGVVLRYPQYGVPWFHQKYCQEKLHEINTKQVSTDWLTLKEEVYEQLCNVLGGWRYVREDTKSQYFNTIDFEVHYDHRGSPVDLHDNSSISMQSSNPSGSGKSFAIQVLLAKDFSADTRQLLSKPRVNSRELELQGWQVVHVNPFSWNSMQLAEDKAKKEYLESSLRQAAVL